MVRADFMTVDILYGLALHLLNSTIRLRQARNTHSLHLEYRRRQSLLTARVS